MVANGARLPHAPELVQALRQAAPALAGLVLNTNTKDTNVILGPSYRTIWGRDFLEERLCGMTFRLSVPSFFQINQPQTQVLYSRAVEFAGLTGTETVVDLYCGIGTISLTMAEHAANVIGVEVVPQAIEDAKENARRNGLADKTRFLCGDASQLALQLEQEGITPDVIVVDPPRKGLAPDVVDTIARMAPPRVVYVSCDPATLGRDLKRFAALGYVAQRAEAVDLFPRTAHIESVVQLSKLNSKQPTTLTLVEPCKRYLQSYLEAYDEYKINGVQTYAFDDARAYNIFEKYDNYRNERNLPPNRVGSDFYWLVDPSRNYFIGEISIRHRLTDALKRYGGHIGYGIRFSEWNKGYGTLMLQLALVKAKHLGISTVLITCDDDNFGSAKVMEKNGLVLQDKVSNIINGQAITTRRYTKAL